MSETSISIILFIHVAFVAVWVGSQVLVAVAVVPSLRRVQDGRQRLEALRVFTRRFNHVAWGAMAVIVISGGLMASERIDDVKAIGGDSIFDLRWGWIFAIKMSMFAVMVALVALHSFVVGPKQLELNQQAVERAEKAGAAAGAETAARTLQRKSIRISVAGLVLSLLVLGAGAFLGNGLFSFQRA